MPKKANVIDLLVDVGRELLGGTRNSTRKHGRKVRGPVIESVDPVVNSVGVEIPVTIRGRHLRGVTRVLFGDVPAVITGREGSTTIMVTAPALSEFEQDSEGPLGVAVTVETGDECGCHTGLGSEPLTFTYERNIPEPAFQLQSILPLTEQPETPDPSAEFGTSLALSADGNILAVGAPGDDGDEGATYMYQRSGPAWSFLQKIQRRSSTAGSQEGFSVALSGDGNTLAIGRPNDIFGIGIVDIYARASTGWLIEESLGVLNPRAPRIRLGHSVALSQDGRTLVAGAPGGLDGGAGYIFTKGLDDVWSDGIPLVGESSPDARQGTSVSISTDGRTVLIGAPGDGAVDPERPSGSVFVWVLRDTWTFASKLEIPAQTADEVSAVGTSVSLSLRGDAIVGSRGAVGVFTRLGLIMWSSPFVITENPQTTPPNTEFGTTVVALDDNSLATGIGKTAGNNRVVIYNRDPVSGDWVQDPVVGVNLTEPIPTYGLALAVSRGVGEVAPSTLAVGAPGASGTGRVFVYAR